MKKSDTDLELVFKNVAGRKTVLNVEEPKLGITKAEIDAAMKVIVDNDVFTSSGGNLAEAVEGRLRTTTLDLVEE